MAQEKNRCYKCDKLVREQVPFEQNTGSVGYLMGGILGQAGFYCADCRIYFCGPCSGTKLVDSWSFEHQRGDLSIPCPLCHVKVSSPIVPASAWQGRLSHDLETKNEGSPPAAGGDYLPPLVGWGI